MYAAKEAVAVASITVLCTGAQEHAKQLSGGERSDKQGHRLGLLGTASAHAGTMQMHALETSNTRLQEI